VGALKQILSHKKGKVVSAGALLKRQSLCDRFIGKEKEVIITQKISGKMRKEGNLSSNRW